jgi:hypothetical protein
MRVVCAGTAALKRAAISSGALAIYKALKAFGPTAGLGELLADLKLRFRRARASGESTNPTPEEPII